MLRVVETQYLVENYLQHADHYSRRLAELNERKIILTTIQKIKNRGSSNLKLKIKKKLVC